jgi:ATP-dependent protease ClpP protease subunit
MKIIYACLISLLLSTGLLAKEKEVVLTQDNTVALKFSVSDQSVSELISDIRKIDSQLKSGYPIYLVLYTPGGSIQAGIELIEFLKGINRPVHTITIFAASMGFQFIQHFGERYVLNYGVLMSHKARGGFQGEFGGGFSQLDSRYGLWLRRLDMMDKQTVDRTKGKQTLKSYRSSYAPELWLNGPEAVAQGYADSVVTAKCDTSLTGTYSKTFRMGMVKIIVDFAKCPLIVAPVSIRASLYTNQGLMTLEDFLTKNGKFGKCKKAEDDSSYSYSDYSSNPTPTIKKNEPCSSDKKLTLDKIDKMIAKIKKDYTKDLKQHIEYSY